MRRSFVVLLLCLSAAGEVLEPFRPEIPVAFEENRGQSRGPFPFVVTHHGAGLSCDGVYWPTVNDYGNVRPLQIRFEGLPSNCSGVPSEPDTAWVHYYGGGTLLLWQQRFRRLRYSGGVEYESAPEGVRATFTFRDVGALRSFRMRWTQNDSVEVRGDTIQSRGGTWRFAGSTAVSATVQEHAVVSFDAASAAGPVRLTVMMALPRVTPSNRVGAFDYQGNWYTVASTNGYAQFDPDTIFCLTAGARPACPDAVVAKFDRSLKLRYLVYLRGRSYERATSVVVDRSGNAYVGGETYSSDFLTTPGVLQTNYAGPYRESITRFPESGDGFLTKIHGDSGGVIYSTLIGTESIEGASVTHVDEQGRTYLLVQSASRNFPSWGSSITDTQHCTSTWPPAGTTWCSYYLSLDENATSIRFSKPSAVFVGNIEDGTAWFRDERKMCQVSPDGEIVECAAIPPESASPPWYLDKAVWTTACSRARLHNERAFVPLTAAVIPAGP